jgi:hypothetical protein
MALGGRNASRPADLCRQVDLERRFAAVRSRPSPALSPDDALRKYPVRSPAWGNGGVCRIRLGSVTSLPRELTA